MKKAIIKLIVLFIAFVNVCLSQDLSTFRKYCDRNSLLVAESSDLTSAVNDFLRYDFATNVRWESVKELVAHADQGFFSDDEMTSIQLNFSRFIEEVQPGSALASVFMVEGKPAWQIIFESNSDALRKEMTKISNSLSRVFFDDFDEDFTLPKEGEIFEITGLNIYWISLGNMVVISNQPTICHRITEDSHSSPNSFRSLNDSRTYAAIANKIGRFERPPSSAIKIQFNPSFVSVLSGLVEEKVARCWQLHEVVGVGLSLNAFKSNENEDRCELVINGFAKVTEPRVGIANAVRLLPFPRELPDLPKDRLLFAFVNLDYDHFENQKKSLFDKAYGAGAYQKYLGSRSIVTRTLGAQFENDRIASLGDTHGTCWYEVSDGYRRCSLSSLDNAELMIKTKRDLSEVLSELSDANGYVETDIYGVPAMISKRESKTLGKVGWVFKDDWIAQGNVEFLDKFVLSNSVPTSGEILELTKHLNEYVSFEKGHSGIVATWPGFWGTKLKGQAIYNAPLQRFPCWSVPRFRPVPRFPPLFRPPFSP
ncbi:MAG: hypothetical protein AAF623_19820 [Planctomycetota bacterium]